MDDRCIDTSWHRSRSTRCALPAGHTGPHRHEVIRDWPDDDGEPTMTLNVEVPVRSIPQPGSRGGFAYPRISSDGGFVPPLPLVLPPAPTGVRRRFRLWREDVALRWRTRTALWVAPWLYDGDDD